MSNQFLYSLLFLSIKQLCDVAKNCTSFYDETDRMGDFYGNFGK